MITPDNYPNDPLGQILNQGWHFLIGLLLALVGLALWPSAALPVACVVTAFYFIGIEWAIQSRIWQTVPRLFWDSVEDTAHCAFGAGVLCAFSAWGPSPALSLALVWLLVLAFSAGRRL